MCTKYYLHKSSFSFSLLPHSLFFSFVSYSSFSIFLHFILFCFLSSSSILHISLFFFLSVLILSLFIFILLLSPVFCFLPSSAFLWLCLLMLSLFFLLFIVSDFVIITFDQMLFRAKCVHCLCGIADGLHGKRSGLYQHSYFSLLLSALTFPPEGVDIG